MPSCLRREPLTTREYPAMLTAHMTDSELVAAMILEGPLWARCLAEGTHLDTTVLYRALADLGADKPLHMPWSVACAAGRSRRRTGSGASISARSMAPRGGRRREASGPPTNPFALITADLCARPYEYRSACDDMTSESRSPRPRIDGSLNRWGECAVQVNASVVGAIPVIACWQRRALRYGSHDRGRVATAASPRDCTVVHSA